MLRQGIIEYFQETDVSRQVDLILREAETELSWTKWEELLEGIRSKRDARELCTAMQRKMESMPDHPAVLAVGCIAEAMNGADDRTVSEHAGAAISNFLRQYGGADEIDNLIGWLLTQTGSYCRHRLAPVLLGLKSHLDVRLLRLLLNIYMFGWKQIACGPTQRD